MEINDQNTPAPNAIQPTAPKRRGRKPIPIDQRHKGVTVSLLPATIRKLERLTVAMQTESISRTVTVLINNTPEPN
ncbi:MAG: hypothetical protein WC100_03455 [Sterolibacterium sp.]